MSVNSSLWMYELCLNPANNMMNGRAITLDSSQEALQERHLGIEHVIAFHCKAEYSC